MPRVNTPYIMHFETTGELGLATYDSPRFLRVSIVDTVGGATLYSRELSDVVNLRAVVRGGKFAGWESRDGITQAYTAPAAVNDLAVINGTLVALCSDGQLYHWTGSAWSALGVVNTEGNLTPTTLLYGTTPDEQVAVVTDGRRVHIYRPADSSRPFHIAYDISGLLEDWITNYTEDSEQALSTGAITDCGNEFTTSNWCDHGSPIDDIPLLRVRARLRSVGSPTGDITAILYDAAGTTVLGASDPIDAATVTTSWDTYEFNFSSTVYLSPDTTYRLTIHYDGGAAGTDEIRVALSNDLTNGYTYDGSTWTALTTSGVLIDIAPGLAPTADHAISYAGRIWLLNPDSVPGNLHYSNVLDPYDWSAIGSGTLLADAQAITIGDGTLPIVTLVPLQTSLYIVTSAKIYRLDGTRPDDFVVKEVLAQASPYNFFCGVNAGSEGVVHTTAGLLALSIVSQTNQFSAAVVSHQITNRLYSFSNPRVAYIPTYGEVWLYDAGGTSDYIYSLNLVLGIWTSYLFNSVTPTLAKEIAGTVYICSSDGSIHTLVPNTWKDNDTFFTCVVQSAYAEHPTTSAAWRTLHVTLDAPIGGSGTISLYRDGSHTADLTLPFSVAFSGLTKIGDLYGVPLSDLYGVPIGGTLAGEVIAYDTAVGQQSYAGFTTSQFDWVTPYIYGLGTIGSLYGTTIGDLSGSTIGVPLGAPVIASQTNLDYPARMIMIRIDITKTIGKIRIRRLGLSGQAMGRFMQGV